MRPIYLTSLSAALVAISSLAHAQFGGPPPEAFTACEGHKVGDACSHPTGHGPDMQGTCNSRGDKLQCIPEGGPPGQGMGPKGARGQGAQGGVMGLDDAGNVMGPYQGRPVAFDRMPIPFERLQPVAYTLPDGKTHWYEVVYLPQGGINWVQAKSLSEQAGGYLVTFHSREENDFVFSLIKDQKFWFKWDGTHNYVMNGPLLGAYQPYGSSEPRGGWKWVSGEPWTYANWAYDGQPGDRDPRPSTQPNDSQGNSNIAAFGEVNDPVPTWGDFPHQFSTLNSPHDGKSYGFIIEYNNEPK
jgi:hypothetical protein